MPRSKSIAGGKTTRANNNSNNNKEQIGAGNPATLPEVQAVVETAPPAVSQEVKGTREAAAAREAKTATEAKVAAQPKVTAEPKSTPDGRKFEIMKTDSRKNVLPINLEDEIRRRAYELYQQRGFGSGSEAEDWLAAEREVRQRYRQQSA
ncbi:MAG: DUF2934 domain-containing protein [Candidatus Sulfotelmatobacter sp.]